MGDNSKASALYKCVKCDRRYAAIGRLTKCVCGGELVKAEPLKKQAPRP
jgi:DNA-directed RNA polymerase subunit RPC12/RpoP